MPALFQKNVTKLYVSYNKWHLMSVSFIIHTHINNKLSKTCKKYVTWYDNETKIISRKTLQLSTIFSSEK